MARNRRITLFVDDAELMLFKSIKAEGLSLSTTIRCLALDKAKWLATHGLKSSAAKLRPEYRDAYANGSDPPWENGPKVHSADDGPQFVPDPQ